MKKVVVFIFILSVFLGGSSVFAVDFGGSIYNDTGGTYIQKDGRFDFTQYDITGLWVCVDVKERLNFYIKGSYAFNYSYLNPPKKPNFFDIESFTVKNIGNNPLIVTVGRFFTSDFTNYVFSNKVDGLSVEFNVPLFTLKALVGYNGFLFKERSTVIMTKADLLDLDNNSRIFAAPRLVGGVDLLFPDLFLKQDLNLALWTQLDLRQSSGLSTGEGRMFSQYYGIGLNGPITDSFYYKGAFYFESGSAYSMFLNRYDYILAYMGCLSVSWYMEKFLSSKAEIEFVYSSGDQDSISFYDGNGGGYSTMFMPISRFSFDKIFSPELGNIFMTRAGYSMKPFSFLSGDSFRVFKNIQAVLSALSFFRSTTGAISEAGVDTNSKSIYLGTEIDGSINGMLFSDFGVFLSGGMFFPNTLPGGTFTESKGIEGKTSLGIFFEF